jgi:hypothetical protein
MKDLVAREQEQGFQIVARAVHASLHKNWENTSRVMCKDK